MQPDPNAVAVARRVRQVLAEVGVSAAEVARQSDWTQAYMARRMSGAVPFSAADLILIAIMLDVAPTRLLPTGPTLTTDAVTR